jgi:hypothetical protein
MSCELLCLMYTSVHRNHYNCFFNLENTANYYLVLTVIFSESDDNIKLFMHRWSLSIYFYDILSFEH